MNPNPRHRMLLENDDNIALWNQLHARKRHHLWWPSEHAVRFLASLNTVGDAVDIGCGSGRHVRLLQQFTNSIRACDASPDALAWTSASLGIPTDLAPMTELPYPDESFDTAIAFGVFYYVERAERQQPIDELYRVLRPGGNALVVSRTLGDWRLKHMVDGRRFVYPGQPEDGMLMHFVDRTEIDDLYAAFSDVSYEVATWTQDDRARVNCDWLIRVTK